MLFQVVKSKKQSNYPTMGNYDVNYGIFISWNAIQLLEMALIKFIIPQGHIYNVIKKASQKLHIIMVTVL